MSKFPYILRSWLLHFAFVGWLLFALCGKKVVTFHVNKMLKFALKLRQRLLQFVLMLHFALTVTFFAVPLFPTWGEETNHPFILRLCDVIVWFDCFTMKLSNGGTYHSQTSDHCCLFPRFIYDYFIREIISATLIAIILIQNSGSCPCMSPLANKEFVL